MNELITIKTNEQGSEVVSARELHEFLEVRSKFADWIKNRIIKYGFLEDTDYVPVSKNLETGGWEHDYALTLDMAKQLSMVERTPKGKEARLYFIEAEKTLRQVIAQPPAPALPSTEQMLLQLMNQSQQLLASQQEQINQLRAEVNQIVQGVQSQRQLAKPTPRLSSPASLRQMIHRRVNDYCGKYGARQGDTYGYLYKRLQQVFGIVVYEINRVGKESYLDALERFGYLDQLYSLAMSELAYVED